ncbi:MAG: hypothetical protein JWM19_2795 [Actinomycetia bacterium]|nr:hypothetical protein [Actinomycetes bacterium]
MDPQEPVAEFQPAGDLELGDDPCEGVAANAGGLRLTNKSTSRMAALNTRSGTSSSGTGRRSRSPVRWEQDAVGAAQVNLPGTRPRGRLTSNWLVLEGSLLGKHRVGRGVDEAGCLK